LIDTIKANTTPAEIREICLKLILLLDNQRDSEDDYDNPTDLLIKDPEAKVVSIESCIPTHVHSIMEMDERGDFDKNVIEQTFKDYQDANLYEETYHVSGLCKEQPNIQNSGSKVGQLKVPKWLITLAALIYLLCM
jgi:hypothetical protein